MMRKAITLGVCAAWLLVSIAIAQVTTATFFGTVTDPSGAIVPEAKVTLTHQDTGTVTTRSAGTYGRIPIRLPPPGQIWPHHPGSWIQNLREQRN
jgi:hypothetical protein